MSKTFGAAIRRVRKTDNSARSYTEKIAIRRSVLTHIDNPSVFDAFAGSGAMYRTVWSEARNYVGCDLRFFRDPRSAFVADNRRVMRSIDLQEFNIFDFDAYGSPWEQCLILAARRQIGADERIGLVLTEGSRLRATIGALPRYLAELAGMEMRAAGANREMNAIIDRALAGLCARWGARIEKQWRAESRNIGQARPIYIGLVLTAD